MGPFSHLITKQTFNRNGYIMLLSSLIALSLTFTPLPPSFTRVQTQTAAYPRAPDTTVPLPPSFAYSYAPSTLVLPSGEEIHYSCAGTTAVVDVILATSSLAAASSQPQHQPAVALRLPHGAGHACDPSVIQLPGTSAPGRPDANWLMAYTTAASEYAPYGNRIGFATAPYDSPQGPFTPLTNSNGEPLLYGPDPLYGIWGGGQPSLLLTTDPGDPTGPNVITMLYTYGNHVTTEVRATTITADGYGVAGTDRLLWQGQNGVDAAIDPATGRYVLAVPAPALPGSIIGNTVTVVHPTQPTRTYENAFDPGLRRHPDGTFAGGVTVSTSTNGALFTYRLQTHAI